jgi:hypothetical protein
VGRHFSSFSLSVAFFIWSHEERLVMQMTPLAECSEQNVMMLTSRTASRAARSAWRAACSAAQQRANASPYFQKRALYFAAVAHSIACCCRYQIKAKLSNRAVSKKATIHHSRIAVVGRAESEITSCFTCVAVAYCAMKLIFYQWRDVV